jgi:hypothetical protein
MDVLIRVKNLYNQPFETMKFFKGMLPIYNKFYYRVNGMKEREVPNLLLDSTETGFRMSRLHKKKVQGFIKFSLFDSLAKIWFC